MLRAAEAVGDRVSVMFSEFKSGIDAYLSGLTDTSIRTLSDVITFNEAHRDEELRFFNQGIMENAAKFGDDVET